MQNKGTGEKIFFKDMPRYQFIKGTEPSSVCFLAPHAHEYAGFRHYKKELEKVYKKEGIPTSTVIAEPVSAMGFALRNETTSSYPYIKLLDAVLNFEDCYLRLEAIDTQLKKTGKGGLMVEMHAWHAPGEKTEFSYEDTLFMRRLGNSPSCIILNPIMALERIVKTSETYMRDDQDEARALLAANNMDLQEMRRCIKSLVRTLKEYEKQIKAVEIGALRVAQTNNPAMFNFYYQWRDTEFKLRPDISNFEKNYCIGGFFPQKYQAEQTELLQRALVIG